MTKLSSRGDTIIELVLAFAIFSLAAVTTVAVLNNGIAVTQRSLEDTLVRQQIDSQAEMLRYVHDTNDPLWQTLISGVNIVSNPQPFNSGASQCDKVTTSEQAFIVYPGTAGETFKRASFPSANYTDEPDTYALINYDSSNTMSQGIWVQVAKAQNNSGKSIEAYDFYIHACWMSVGSGMPETLGTIVRLYDGQQ
ncbi:MAG: hypothetical protein ABI397_01940 [Candidatus Saccharimonas sp.]